MKNHTPPNGRFERYRIDLAGTDRFILVRQGNRHEIHDTSGPVEDPVQYIDDHSPRRTVFNEGQRREIRLISDPQAFNHTDDCPYFTACNACQIFCGVAGIWTYSAPACAMASFTAFMTAASAPTVPASPAPLTPSGLMAVGTTLLPIS